MTKLYWRIKAWYYRRFHGVILGRIAPVQTFKGKPTHTLKGSDQHLVEMFKFKKEQP